MEKYTKIIINNLMKIDYDINLFYITYLMTLSNIPTFNF
jgi:hypothetical protein